METSKIIAQFCLLTGLSEEESKQWEDFCSQAAKEILNSLKSTVNPNEYEEKLCYLAASLAFYRYSLKLASSDDVGDFTVGDIKSSSNKNLMYKAAKELYDEARNSAKNLLEDDEFYFGRCSI